MANPGMRFFDFDKAKSRAARALQPNNGFISQNVHQFTSHSRYHSTMPYSSTADNPTTFLAEVFRRTVMRGWERFLPHGMTPSQLNTSTSKSSKNRVNSLFCQVTPKKQLIEIRDLKLRVKLSQATLMVRRARSVMIAQEQKTSKAIEGRHTVLIVLQFEDIGECAKFSDIITNLNMDYISTSDAMETIKDIDNYSEKRFVKRQRLHTAEQQVRTNGNGNTEVGGDMISFIVGLLYDDGFRQFVDNIEQAMEKSRDCANILALLGKRNAFADIKTFSMDLHRETKVMECSKQPVSNEVHTALD